MKRFIAELNKKSIILSNIMDFLELPIYEN